MGGEPRCAFAGALVACAHGTQSPRRAEGVVAGRIDFLGIAAGIRQEMLADRNAKALFAQASSGAHPLERLTSIRWRTPRAPRRTGWGNAALLSFVAGRGMGGPPGVT